MTATRILYASVLALLVTVPAQAGDEDVERAADLEYCLETWPDDRSAQSLCFFERTIRRHSRRGFEDMYFDDGSPPRCADEGRASSGQLSCSTEPLNIADAPQDHTTTDQETD